MEDKETNYEGILTLTNMIMDSENYKPVECCDKCIGLFGVIGCKGKSSCPCHQDLGQTELREWEKRFDEKFCQQWDENIIVLNHNKITQNNIKSFISNLLFSQEQRHREDLDKLLEQGHGGGNWRRLIMQLKDKYLKN